MISFISDVVSLCSLGSNISFCHSNQDQVTLTNVVTFLPGEPKSDTRIPKHWGSIFTCSLMESLLSPYGLIPLFCFVLLCFLGVGSHYIAGWLRNRNPPALAPGCWDYRGTPPGQFC